MRRVVPLLLAAACGPAPEPTASWVEPIDGYTGLPGDAPLAVVSPAIAAPDDYPIPERVRVVDLNDGGFVPGEIASDGPRLVFTPASAWLPDRRYAWTFDSLASIPHGPEWSVPEGLVGTAVFDTDPSLEVLGAGLHPDGRACFVLSAKAPEPTMVVGLTIDDEEAGPEGEVEILAIPVEEWASDLIEAGLEPAVDVACMPPQIEVATGSRLRVWFGSDGPWLAELSESPPGDLVAARHRFVPADEGDTDDQGDIADEEAP